MVSHIFDIQPDFGQNDSQFDLRIFWTKWVGEPTSKDNFRVFFSLSWLNTPLKTNMSPQKRDYFNLGNISSNHPFSGLNSLLVSGSVTF